MTILSLIRILQPAWHVASGRFQRFRFCAWISPDVTPRGELMASMKVIGKRRLVISQKARPAGSFMSSTSPAWWGRCLMGSVTRTANSSTMSVPVRCRRHVVDDVNAVGLQPFDFAAAVKSAPKHMDTIVLDGTNVEIRVMTPSGELRLEQWNPGATIDDYAPYNTDIGKLKSVLDILALYIGRSRMGI